MDVKRLENLVQGGNSGREEPGEFSADRCCCRQ